MLPFELVVHGIPVSAQTRNRNNLRLWKAKVAAEAHTVWPAASQPVGSGLEFKITYYFDQDGLDVDNIIKPIQDALVGVVYVDDSQVMRTSCRKRDLNSSYRIRGASAALLLGFASNSDFVHVSVKDYSDGGDLTQ